MIQASLKILTLISLVFLTSCFALFDSNSDKILGKYIVLWIDTPNSQSISEQFEVNSNSSSQIIPEYVFQVGHNNDFIIAKQHPTTGFDGGFEIDTSITNYFVIDMNRKLLKKGNKYYGPLTRIKLMLHRNLTSRI